MTARTSGTTAATTAPKATSRMRNVSGIVSRSDASSPPLTSSSMSSLASVLSSEWIRRSGCAARSSSRNDRNAASRASSAAPSPGTSGAMRTVDRSADIRPASGGARRGSTTFANSGSPGPSTTGLVAVVRRPGDVSRHRPGTASQGRSRRARGVRRHDPGARRTDRMAQASPHQADGPSVGLPAALSSGARPTGARNSHFGATLHVANGSRRRWRRRQQ